MLETVGRPKKPEGKVKTQVVAVPVDEQTLTEFRLACELRGTSMAGLLHPIIVQTIREEKDRTPDAFKHAHKKKRGE